MSDTWVYDFSYRGRAPDDPAPPAWHLEIVSAAGRKMLSMSKAAEEGIELPSLLAGINAEVLAENEALRTRIAEMEQTTAHAEEKSSRIAEEARVLVFAQQEMIRIHKDKIAELEGKLDERKALVTSLQEDMIAVKKKIGLR